jgi:hypothetical protein
MIRRLLRLAPLVVAIGFLGGCQETVIQFHAAVEPALGHVPYAAKIVCTPLGGEYTYTLPDGTQVRTRESELDVTVDQLNWVADVSWSDGKQIREDEAVALGNNAPPVILRPLIDGDASRWYLRPGERTLIDFNHRERSMYSPETGVVYDGPFQIVEIRVEADLKVACGGRVSDSIFCPPYEAGAFHALYGGSVWENACIVYPLYTGETAPNGLPYAPAAEDGYIHDIARNRSVFYGVAFPAQSATITVVVEDEWGRLTAGSFEIPVQAVAYRQSSPGEHEDEPVEFELPDFFVSARNETYYYPAWCSLVCRIPMADRIYFVSVGDAIAAGKQTCVDCCVP